MSTRAPLPPIDPRPEADEGWAESSPGFGEFAFGSGIRDVLAWIAALLLTVTLAAWIAAYSAAQSTSDQVALPALERAIAVLTEVDRLIDVHGGAITEQVIAGDDVELPGYPLDVTVPAPEAETPNALRDALLAESAARVRAEGSGVFLDPSAEVATVARFSSAGLMQAVMDGLAAHRHDRWAGYVSPLAGASVLLATLVVLLAVGVGRFVRLGAIAVAAAALVVVPAVALRVGIGFVGEDDVVGIEAREIAASLLGSGVRNALWLAAAGLAILVPAAILDRVFLDSDSARLLRRRPRAGDGARE